MRAVHRGRRFCRLLAQDSKCVLGDYDTSEFYSTFAADKRYKRL